MVYNTGFPMSYQPYINYPQYSNQYNGMNNMGNMNNMNNVPMQYSMNNQNMQQNMNTMSNMNTMNNMNGMNYNNGNGNFDNQYSNQSIPQLPLNNDHSMSTNDIVWVQNEQEVVDYPVGNGNNVMFIDINQMKLYTKDGSTGLIRDFTLCESQESIQRCQQLQQIQNAQFPVIDTTATVVDTEQQTNNIINTIEQKLDAKLNDFEQKLNAVSQDLGGKTSTTKTTKARSIKKEG